jgi:hypothetical protein
VLFKLSFDVLFAQICQVLQKLAQIDMQSTAILQKNHLLAGSHFCDVIRAEMKRNAGIFTM